MNAVHFNFDSAWPEGAISLPCLDLTDWGPRLRYLAPSGLVEAFYARVKSELADFTLYGSGDFHYLTALWLRRQGELVTVVSFDNHPDWDLRPPRWPAAAGLTGRSNCRLSAGWQSGVVEILNSHGPRASSPTPARCDQGGSKSTPGLNDKVRRRSSAFLA